MASLARPSKRQKQDHVGREVFEKPEVSAISRHFESTPLLPLVEGFAQTSFECSEDLIEIIGKIRSHSYFQKCNDLQPNSTSCFNDHNIDLPIRKLHGTLILYLGFLLGTRKQTSIAKARSEEVLHALLLCLRDLYASNKSVELLQFDVEEEFNELFILVPKICVSTSSKSFSRAKTFPVNFGKKIKLSCYQIIKSWLNIPVLLKKVLTESTTTTVEIFLLCLLRSRDSIIVTGSNERDDVYEVLERLRSLCDENSEFRTLLDVTSSVLRSHPSSPCRHLPPRLNIFYWRCVSGVMFEGEPTTRKNTEEEIADRAVDSMMHYCTFNNHILSRQALACIGEFIQISSHDSHIRVAEFARKAILEMKPTCDGRATKYARENSIDGNLLQTLDCFGFCMKKASASEFVLRMKDWEKIFDRLVLLTEDEEDMDIAEKATSVLIPTLKTLITGADHRSSIMFRKSINILLKLISSNHAWITGETLELLFAVTENSEIRRCFDFTALSPDLVNALGLLASKNFLVEESKKSKLAQTFAVLIDEIKSVHFLVRKSPNLAFLVRLANGSYCETDQSRVQQIAICTLMKLARNPCNQRILAKEPGLLSSLIRYTRVTPEGAEIFSERSISRKEMKDGILLMANAL